MIDEAMRLAGYMAWNTDPMAWAMMLTLLISLVVGAVGLRKYWHSNWDSARNEFLASTAMFLYMGAVIYTPIVMIAVFHS